MNEPPAIHASGVTKTYPGGARALRGVDLTVRPGEGVVLLGPNGCGKSTLLRTLNGLERHDGGSLLVDGTDLGSARGAQLRTLRTRVGVVFQKLQLVPGMSAFQNVLFGALGRRSIVRLTTATASREDREFAMRCLERVGLADLASQPSTTMSGGQQQRIAIARMLMQRPKIVLADEPIASLDPRAGAEIMDLLWSIVQEDQLTVLCTLHHIEIALASGQRIVGMREGRKVLDAPASEMDHATLGSLYRDIELQGATA